MAVEAPPMNVMTAMPRQNPYGVQSPPAYASQVPGYTTDPGYAMVGMAKPPDARYANDAALRAQTVRRRAIIVLVSALIAVAIGIVVLLALRGNHDADTSAISKVKPRESSQVAPPVSPADIRPEPPAPRAQPAPPPTGSPSANIPDTPPTGATNAVAETPPAAGDCFADVSSAPTGAEIVLGENNVIGTTPKDVVLPCGKPVDLLIRKNRHVPVLKTITPTPEGAKLRVTLAKQTFQVRVSSTPPGATITLAGRSLGVTPALVNVPAFELSVLALTKEGYAIATEKVVANSSGLSFHTTLTRLERAPR